MAMTEFPAGRLDNIEFVVIFTRYKGKWLPESEMDLDFFVSPSRTFFSGPFAKKK